MNRKFRGSFNRDLKNIKNKVLQERIAQAIAAVEEAKSLQEVKNIQKLTDSADCFRIRVGEYRIGIFLDGDLVEFVRCLHRREFYRYFG